MASFSRHDIRRSLKAVRWPLRLTRLGMLAEVTWRAFWPALSIAMLVLAALMLGLQDSVLVEVVWVSTVIAALGFVVPIPT